MRGQVLGRSLCGLEVRNAAVSLQKIRADERLSKRCSVQPFLYSHVARALAL